MIILYGIKNCDTVKKATQWFTNNNIAYDFHDYKSKGISENKLREWCKQVGWESLINKKGTTWRQLDENVKATTTNESSAIVLMKENTSLIKRPLIEKEDKIITLGFEEKKYEQLFL